MYKLVLVLASLLLGACSNNKQYFTPLVIPDNNTQSVVYIYRPDSMANRFTTPGILFNNTEQFKLRNNHYDYLLIEKGKHQLQLELPGRFTGKQQIILEIEPNRHYFVKLSTSIQFKVHHPYTRRFDLQIVPEEIALLQIRKLNASKKHTQETTPTPSATTEKTEEQRFSILKTRNPFAN